MRLSSLFSLTLRESPADSEVASHQLLVRAGFIRQLGSGIFTFLPLGLRSLERIKQVMREELNGIGGQELLMPVVQPADVWKETGRYFQIGSEMGRFRDKTNHDMVLAMTHEEVVSDLTRGIVRSYRQLPALIYHIQTKWRDDPRPRAGLIRVREFMMLDSYSLDADWEGLDAQYQAHYNAYFRIFKRCGLPVVAVKSDTGMMGGKLAHEYMYLTPIGEDTLVFCDGCGYSSNRQVAVCAKPIPPGEDMLPMKKIETPEMKTIEELAGFLHISPERTAKAVFYMALINNGKDEVKEDLLIVIVRGDMEVNETKLANLVGARELRPATNEEIERSGAVPGYASPVGLQGVRVVVDDLVPKCPNLVAGANQSGFHLLNVNYERDYIASLVADVVNVKEGDNCPVCSAPLRLTRGVEVGNIFKLGSRYSEALRCYYLDENGEMKPVIMGSYGIGLGRLLACVAEEHHDERGLIWPVSIAPYPVHLVILSGRVVDTFAIGKQVEELLTSNGLETLVDDREESAGVKFADADLIGLPVRLTVSERAFKQGGIEIKARNGSTSRIVEMQELVTEIKKLLECLEQNLN